MYDSKNTRSLRRALLCLSAALVFLSFIQVGEPERRISLKRFVSHKQEKWTEVRTGMLWSLSQLGAALPAGSLERSLQFQDSLTFTMDLSVLGFSEEGLKALDRVLEEIRDSEEYRKQGYLDLAKFFVLTLHSSRHYYAITGVQRHYGEFVKKYALDQPVLFGLTRSAVSKGNRKILFTKDSTVLKTGFVAVEGHGSLQDGTFREELYEVFDLMPNGQFRYAVYNKRGELMDASDPAYSEAGKPSKCMWCHEVVIQPLFKTNTDVKGMLSSSEYSSKVAAFQEELDKYRKGLQSDIDYEKKQDHTFGELLYIAYMEPSYFRLEQERKDDTFSLKKIKRMNTHVYAEFPLLGDLYHRKEVDACSAMPRMPVPHSVREKNEAEPDFFTQKGGKLRRAE